MSNSGCKQRPVAQTLALMCVPVLLLGGCSTIHFTHDLPANREVANTLPSRWHDTAMDGMIEISPPLNLYQECLGKPWQKVTVEYTFNNGLVTSIAGVAAESVIPLFYWINPYMPWTVETTCAQ
ncbi:hypothetical protein ACQUQU_14070 [Thalassolituus sp. LLYu03]|uniref:hypothetical protein n=1 Tax=Thalassolituus sp. LLYu03 TaxID=3421656 RepID=UPI003D28DD2C